jgi:hypothetical protein
MMECLCDGADFAKRGRGGGRERWREMKTSSHQSAQGKRSRPPLTDPSLPPSLPPSLSPSLGGRYIVVLIFVKWSINWDERMLLASCLGFDVATEVRH